MQSTPPIVGKLYVCDSGAAPIASRVAGPFDSAAEAYAAAGALEAEFPDLHSRTEVWLALPSPEFAADPVCFTPPALPASYGQDSYCG